MTALSQKADFSNFPTLTREEARRAAERLLRLTGSGAPADGALQARVDRFYKREARLLDEERFHEWYDLLADDLFYWMPLRQNRYRREKPPEADPADMALFDERKADIAVRIGRLDSNLVWTEDPPTRHTYMISNVEVFHTPVDGEYEVHSVFLQVRNRGEHDDVSLAGRRRDVLRSVGDHFQIAARLILVPQSVLLTKNLTAFF